MYNFLREGKPEKLKRDILTTDYKNGGLKMIDIEIHVFIKSFKVSWIKEILDLENKELLNKIYLEKLRPFYGKLLFECNLSENDFGITSLDGPTGNSN